MIMTSQVELKALTSLRSAPLTADMDSRHLKKLASLAREKTFPTGAILDRKGELGNALYLIEAGEQADHNLEYGIIRRAGKAMTDRIKMAREQLAEFYTPIPE
jgi:hypothetical protein